MKSPAIDLINSHGLLIREPLKRVHCIIIEIHVIVTPPGSPKVNLDRIKEVEEEMDLEYIRRFDKRKKR